MACTNSKMPTSKELALQFGKQTSMHGIGRVLSKKMIFWERIFWTCLVMGMSGWALLSVFSTVREYFRHPVSTVVGLNFNPPLRFPGVTFCNMNRMRKSKMSNITYDIIEQALEQSTPTNKMLLTRLIKGLLDGLPTETAVSAGHSLNDMLVGCVFDSKKCGPENFIPVFNPSYGNCFIFGHELLTVSNAGRLSGLTLDLNAQIEEYTPLASSLGIIVLLHDPRTMPFPENSGLTVTTGQVTSIGIKERRVRDLPAPYSDCLENSFQPRLNIFSQAGYFYSREACIRTNFQRELLRVCGCCSKWSPCSEDLVQEHLQNDAAAKSGNISDIYCSVPPLTKDALNTSSKACYLRMLELIDRIDLMQGCPQACSQTLYQTTISASGLPYRDLLAYARQFHPEQPQSDSMQSQPSIVRVEIFFQDLSTEYSTAVPVYDGNKLLGDVGGQLGLLLGFSLVTGVEIIDLLVRLVTATILRARGTPSTDKVDQHHHQSNESGEAQINEEGSVNIDVVL